MHGKTMGQRARETLLTCRSPSSWFYAVCTRQYLPFVQSSENPELRRTLMYALVALANAPLHAHFVFDGVNRPSILTVPPWIVGCLQELLPIFGFTWSMVSVDGSSQIL